MSEGVEIKCTKQEVVIHHRDTVKLLNEYPMRCPTGTRNEGHKVHIFDPG